MAPNDPRHGTQAGYHAHLDSATDPCAGCLQARRRARKAREIERHNGVPAEHSYDELLDVLSPWLAQGLGPSAITHAAGLGAHRGSRILTPGRPVLRSTYKALAAVTEDHFGSSSKVWSHLTDQRVGSLMAAGFTVTAMPINLCGQWRYRDRISVGLARTVRDYYLAHQHREGTNNNVRARALRAGRRPPVAWDDPGTLAWPLGWTEPTSIDQAPDEVVVERILAGEWRLRSTRTEKVEVVARWRESGKPLNRLARETGWKVERYYDPNEQVA